MKSLSIHATMWTDLRNMTLSERRHEQMTYSMIPFLRHSKGGKSYQHSKKPIRGGPSWEWGRAKDGLYGGTKSFLWVGMFQIFIVVVAMGVCVCHKSLTCYPYAHAYHASIKLILKKQNTVRRGTLIRLYRCDWTM